MPQSREYQTEVIVLRKIKLGEADRILYLYSPEYGKFEAVAKGVRRPKSKLAGHLELLTHSQVRLARGRNLDTITGSQVINSFADLRNDLLLTTCGLYSAELVYQFSAEHAADPQLFALILGALELLSKACNSELVLRYFELTLMERVGFRPQLHECVACHCELKPVTNAFSPLAGGVLCPSCEVSDHTAFPMSVDALKVLRLFQRSDYSIVPRLRINSELASELKLTLSSYIRYLLEREIKSADWLESLNEQLNHPVRSTS